MKIRKLLDFYGCYTLKNDLFIKSSKKVLFLKKSKIFFHNYSKIRKRGFAAWKEILFKHFELIQALVNKIRIKKGGSACEKL